MRRIRDMIMIASLGLLFATSGARAGEYLSGFGFAISVPDVYLVLTRDEVRRNAAVFLEPDGTEGVGEIPAPMRQEVYQRVEAGELEIFYRTAGFDDAFVDNVNVMIQQAELPHGSDQVEAVCRLLPGEFSRLFGRPIGLDGCEMRTVAGRPALYLFFDGALPGTKTLQYQIQRRAGETLILTATAADTNISRMMGEFESMVASIRAR